MTDQIKHRDIGALFKNNKRKHDKAPILVGTIEFSPSLIRHLNELLDEREPAVLSLSGWKNISSRGLAYYTIKAQKQYVPPEREPQRPRFDEDLDL